MKEKRRAEGDAPPVVLIHGLSVPALVMEPLAFRLRRYGRRTHVIRFNTWTNDLPECALIVSRAVEELGLERFDAVCHSMGGIILRWAMNHCEMPRLRRAVMIGTPNSGSWLADHLDQKMGKAFPWVYGEAALQLRPSPRGIVHHAGLLKGAEVGVIAGGSGTPEGKRNWFGIEGDNDGVVAVEETILPGMRDFVLLNSNHSKLTFSSQTAHMANLFLDHGVFRPRPPKEKSNGHESDSED